MVKMAYFTGNVAYKRTISSDLDTAWKKATIACDTLECYDIDVLSLSSFTVLNLNLKLIPKESFSHFQFELIYSSPRNTFGTVVIERETSTVEKMINIGIVEFKSPVLRITNPGLFVKGYTYRILGQITI